MGAVSSVVQFRGLAQSVHDVPDSVATQVGKKSHDASVSQWLPTSACLVDKLPALLTRSCLAGRLRCYSIAGNPFDTCASWEFVPTCVATLGPDVHVRNTGALGVRDGYVATVV